MANDHLAAMFRESDVQSGHGIDDGWVSGAKPIPNLENLKAFDACYSWRQEQVKIDK